MIKIELERVQGDYGFEARDAYGHVVKIAIIADFQNHIAFQLIKELFHGIVVVVGSFIRTADYLHCHVSFFKHFLVSDWRL